LSTLPQGEGEASALLARAGGQLRAALALIGRRGSDAA